MLELQGRPAPRDQPVQQAQQGLLAQLVLLALPALMGLPALQALPEHPARLDQLDRLALQVLLVRPPVLLDPRVLPALLGQLVLQDQSTQPAAQQTAYSMKTNRQ